jgi:hypothetical protein
MLCGFGVGGAGDGGGREIMGVADIGEGRVEARVGGIGEGREGACTGWALDVSDCPRMSASASRGGVE